MAIFLGKEAGIPHLVSAVNHKEHLALFQELGATTMENPEEIVALHLYNSIKRPQLVDLVTLAGGAQIFKATVTEKSPLVGRPLRESGKQGKIPQYTLIIAVEREGKLIIPSGNTVLQPGDLITVFSNERASDELVKRFTG
jgi:trk system potassium uptake protein TrkA